ncbi:mitochondrial 39-S ribosomal protein L47 (MRP-L47)-domain-containing protein [Entophlyctis helioformis]|nr:mitochondrial 39-S ribosomal protein L47 (MRP-L47)-domain-containing protein [Entophlyctis helioformis]
MLRLIAPQLHTAAALQPAATLTVAAASASRLLSLTSAASRQSLAATAAAATAHQSPLTQTRSFSSTPSARGLEDFFDSGSSGWVWTETELPTGRAWTAAELRNKSFDDLHKLWWVCAKEQNKLYSQVAEARRFQLYFPHKDRLVQVRLTMNRIKMVVWERRTAWMQAQALLKVEQARAELKATGQLTDMEIEAKLLQMFPKPIEAAGEAAERKRFTAKTSRTQRYTRKNPKAKPSIWTVV